MKKLFLFLIGVFIIHSFTIKANNFNGDEVNIENVFANKFYKYDNNKIVSLNKESITKMWEAQLKEEGYNVKLKDFTILKSVNEAGKNVYFLKAVSENGEIETGAFFTPTEKGMKLIKKECTCSGCPDGCNLTISGDYCRCSSCFNNGTCTKTEKATSGLTELSESFEP